MNLLKSGVLALVFLNFLNSLNAQTLPPNDFLPHIIGEEFTPHHLLVDYMYHVADENDNVLISEYGRTNQKRPLLNLLISAQENIDNIEKIRLNNLFRAGIPGGVSYPEVDHVTLVWLSFSVHGNEAAGSESSMPVLYDLVSGKNAEIEKWLENTVVIFDPSINPDGYSRYTHWHRNVAEKMKSPEIEDREHSEPWPGGRVNHYLFDLNRDWAWQTQVESQQRMKVYNRWLPQVHVDFHEMGANSPYYFAPAAAPFHNYISKWQNDFQTTIGKNHAKYFDKKGWLYFTREVFDLFYPSYGDTYPTFNGAIGMTYEQGGGPGGGRSIDLENGEILTLQDRVQHHYTTALSTIEAASVHADELILEFKKFYAQEALGRFKSYIIKGDNKEKVSALASLLDRQGIQYMWAKSGGSGKGFNFQTGRDGDYKIEDGDLIVSTDQAKKTLIQVLLDPESVLQDSLTYDITAWSLPYAYGLQAYASTTIIRADTMITEKILESKEEDYYALIVHWESVDDAKLIAQLHKERVTMRLSSVPFTIKGKQFNRNSVIITKADNKSKANSLLKIIKDAGAEEDDYAIVQTGFSDAGADLGSSKMGLLKEPKVLILSGDKTSANSFGQVWHFFEQVLEYPITIVDSDRLFNINMDKYNVLVVSDGWYGFSEGELNKLKEWIRKGGKLLSVGYANRSFADKDGFALKKYATDDEKKEVEEVEKQNELIDRFHSYEGAERRRIVNNVPGAIFQVDMDETHPLSYGIGKTYYSLKTGGLNFRPLKGAHNVGIIPNDGLSVGFTGSVIKKQLRGSVDFAVEDMGRGSIVYMIDNPLFRGFWKEGQLLFSNALFLVN